ncbi:propionyl-CoA carboxylase alpha chain, partial [Streptomyces sp. DvalAA-14]|uniref:acetyl-CoA carboxylase biotin carboxyl carrier protein subunit n=1 Tax=unclassified Streptomyces TaxID=2593676 RepID=UPI00081B81EC
AQRHAVLAAALADAARRTGSADGPLPVRLGGWRNVPSQPQAKRFRHEPGGWELEVRYRLHRGALTAEGHPDVALVSAAADRVVLDIAGVRRAFAVTAYAEQVFVDAPWATLALTALPRFGDPRERAVPGSLLAPMPGTVVRAGEFVPGDRVGAGQPLLWLEAMKMEHVITAPVTGTLTELNADIGRQVEVGAVLAVVKEESGP